jgi:hypothetical protein
MERCLVAYIHRTSIDKVVRWSSNDRSQKSAASIGVAHPAFNLQVAVSDCHYINFVSTDVRKHTLQLIQRIVADHQLPLTFFAMLDLHWRT